MEFIKEKTLLIFKVVFSGIFLYVLGVALFDSSQWYYNQSTLVLVGLSIIIVLLAYYLVRLLNKLSDNIKKVIIIGAFLIIIFLQLIFAYYMRVNPTWDFGEIFHASINLATNGDYLFQLPFYFWGRYPNNIGIVLLLSMPFKIVAKFTQETRYFYFVGILINMVIINLSLIGLVYIIKKNVSLNAAVLTSVFMITITPIYSYVSIIYTDTLTMIFPIAALFFIILSNRYSGKKAYLFITTAAIILLVGSFIKTNVIIFLVALLIYIIYKYSLKDMLISIVSIAIISIAVQISFNGWMQAYIPIPLNEAGLPKTHWVMMGMTGIGFWSQEEVSFTSELYDNEGKDRAEEENIRVIKERLNNYGVSGYLKFLKEKIKVTWNDGTYYAVNKLEREPFKPESTVYKYVAGDKDKIFVYMSQLSHILLIFGIFLSGILTLKEKMDFLTFSQIAILGNFIFLLIWETRSRYLVYFIPIMVLVSIYGYFKLYNKIQTNELNYLQKEKVKNQI